MSHKPTCPTCGVEFKPSNTVFETRRLKVARCANGHQVTTRIEKPYQRKAGTKPVDAARLTRAAAKRSRKATK